MFAPEGVFCLSYPNDALSDDIDALITGADALSAAADSIATITSGSDVVVSNFDHVEAVFDNLQALLGELKSGHFYCPVGMVSPFAGGSGYVPSGWLLCSGQAFGDSGAGIGPVSADLQAMLVAAGFSAVPDLRGRVIAAPDDMGSLGDAGRLDLANTLGTVAGAQYHALTTGELASHNHTFSGTTNSNNVAHIHGLFQYDILKGFQSGSSFTFRVLTKSLLSGGTAEVVTTSSEDPVTHNHPFSGTTANNGSGSAHNNMQPTMLLNYIIKN